MGDQRDEITWVALELTRQGEIKAEEGTLAEELRSSLGVDCHWPVFVPSKVYSRNGKKITVHLMEGYAFVASGLDEITYFHLEQDRKLVEQVMTQKGPHGMRVLSVIPDLKIQELSTQLIHVVAADIQSGARVKVVDGKYRGLYGDVVELDEDFAVIYIDELRTLKTLARVPRICLETLEEDDE